MWTAKRIRWATAREVRAFLKRNDPVGVVDFKGSSLKWMTLAEVASFWAHAHDHFSVPGRAGASNDVHGSQWGAHIWGCGKERLLIFEEFV